MDTIKLIEKPNLNKKNNPINLYFDILVNDKPLRDILKIRDSDFFNDFDFLLSCKEPRNYSMYTCSCGQPACAGFYDPFKIEHKNDIIEWEINETYHGKKLDRPLVFRFKKEEYMYAGKKIIEALKSTLLFSKRENKEINWIYDIEWLLDEVGELK